MRLPSPAGRPRARRYDLVCLLPALALWLGHAPARAAERPEPPGAAKPAAQSEPAARLGRARLAYERGDYPEAVTLLRGLLYPTAQLTEEDQVVLGHKLLGLCYFFARDLGNAEQEFVFLLSLRPDFALDPLLDPVKAVAFVDDLRRRDAARLAELRRRQAEEDRRRKQEDEDRLRRAEEEARRRAPRVFVVAEQPQGIGPLTFVPFGAPQLARRRTLVGGLLLSGEALFGGASLASWLTVRLRYPNGTFPPGELNLARGLTATYLTAGVLFWGIAITGLTDALIDARRRSAVRFRVLTTPPPGFSEAELQGAATPPRNP